MTKPSTIPAPESLTTLLGHLEDACVDCAKRTAKIERVFLRFQAQELEHVFFETVFSRLTHDDVTFDLYAKLAVLSTMADRYVLFNDWVRPVLDDRSRKVCFAPWDHISRLNSIRHSAIQELLVDLRYGHLGQFDVSTRLFEMAERLSFSIKLNRSGIEYLYGWTRTGLTFQDWERQLLIGFTVELMTRELRVKGPLLDAMSDHESTLAVVEHLAGLGGGLILISHSGLIIPRASFVTQRFSDALLMAASPTAVASVSVGEDRRSALFEGLRALQDNKLIVIAPDGKAGSLKRSLTILGKSYPIGEGAMFLAYESRKPTVWFDILVVGERFVPEAIRGPQRQDGESYKEFCHRFTTFYEAMLYNQLSGNPMGISMIPRWFNLFAS